MKKWIVTFESDTADVEREDEFNEWYNKIHLPDVLETAGVVRATRYERLNPQDGQRKYLAVYEVEADDLDTVMAQLKIDVAKKHEQGRMSDLLDGEAGGMFVEIYSTEST